MIQLWLKAWTRTVEAYRRNSMKATNTLRLALEDVLKP